MRSMRAYELMIIFDGDVEDTGVTETPCPASAQQVEAGGGKVAKTDLWGRRRFAYEINHKFEGIYVVLEIVTEAVEPRRRRAVPPARGRGRPPQVDAAARPRGRPTRPGRGARAGRGQLGPPES